ncbi:nucleoside triphosphate pyrophosphohydrolase [Fusobacterium sp.]|uniref:nucleoside triphosphate pyrophosphohydrolase n=1 Tax=Fusobacterium sp. TaxID=68766 RepID=UPI0025B8AECC|nr:nucleoside triphosphate pyrophosphohydrolase [Fusobacterium sp.]
MKMKEFERLVQIIKVLRGENGCPWDREQTLESLKPCLREEVAELLEAMEGDVEEHKGELGDVLMNLVFQADICEDEGKFNIEDVAYEINEKLIRRHPHVFKKRDEGITTDEVLVNWDEIKKTEKLHENRKSALDGVPKYLPALSKAQKIQKKASKVGFDWENIDQVIEKLYEEIDELKVEISKKDRKNIEEELGDVLFSVVNIARFLDVDATEALEKTIKKFDRRFRYVEEKCDVKKAKLDELENFWNEAKKEIDL